MLKESQSLTEKLSGISQIFTFDYPFDTGSSTLDYILGFIFILIPGILLAMAAYFTIFK
jgi:hypothetical protein